MNPRLIEKEFVFCTISQEHIGKLHLEALLTFKEAEGITIIIEKEKADSNTLSYSQVWKMITLQVHSDLSAVGLLAAITNKLAKEGISVNVISGYYHDHLFVPIKMAEKSIDLLQEFVNSSA